MQYKASSPEDYIKQLPKERQIAIRKIRELIIKNLPKGFEETMCYGMIGYVVPHSIYSDGYHCTPELPLPFINIASQKNFVAVYHMGIYAEKKLYEWFTKEFPKYTKRKLDMGKSCIRFKYMDDIPYELIGELVKKMTVDDWITVYENNIKKK